MSAEPLARNFPTVAPPAEDGTSTAIMVELVCDSRTRETAMNMAAQWCQLRAISPRAGERVTRLLDEAASYGLRFRPRSLRLRVLSVGHRQILVALTWRGCHDGAVLSTAELERTAETFEAHAEVWGFEATRPGPTHWFVVDAAE